MQTNHAQDNTAFQGKRAAIFAGLKSATRVVAELTLTELMGQSQHKANAYQDQNIYTNTSICKSITMYVPCAISTKNWRNCTLVWTVYA